MLVLPVPVGEARIAALPREPERLVLPGGVLVRHAEGAAVATPHDFNERLLGAAAESALALRIPESGKQR